MKAFALILISLVLIGCVAPSRLGVRYQGEEIGRFLDNNNDQNHNITLSVHPLTKEDVSYDVDILRNEFESYIYKNADLNRILIKYPGLKINMEVLPDEEIKRTWILDIAFFYPGLGVLLPYTPWWGNVKLDAKLTISVNSISDDFKFSTIKPFIINAYPYYRAGKILTTKYSAAYNDLFEQLKTFNFSEFAEKVEKTTPEISPIQKDTLNDKIAAQDHKITLCNYELIAGSAGYSFAFGLVGAIIDASKNSHDHPYYENLRTKLVDASEKILIQNPNVQYILCNQFVNQQVNSPVTLDAFARNNGLIACISVQTSLGICVGWSKKVNMSTIWKITSISGNVTKIKTYSESREGQGLGPDVGDPKLEPIWLELAEENAKQFLERISHWTAWEQSAAPSAAMSATTPASTVSISSPSTAVAGDLSFTQKNTDSGSTNNNEEKTSSSNQIYSVQNKTSEMQSQKIKNHFLDLGVGFGLDYGGIIGAKLSYILPFPYISVFGAIGAQPLGLGWSVGTTFHILPQNSKYLFRPNLKIMYGINRTTMVDGASEYDAMFAGWTPGIGLEFMFGKRKANGFDIDLNFPIGSLEFDDQLYEIDNDPRVGAITMSPIAFSIGYHHEF